MPEKNSQTVFSTWLKTMSSPARGVDACIIALILGFGALQFFLYQRSNDFIFDDVFIADCARSLLQHGFYGIGGRLETNQPPGTSAILAALCFLGGCSHAAYLRTMALVSTLGFLVSYFLLRSQLPRAVAGSICLLLISSQIYFSLGTQLLTSCFPYFFTTISALLVARRFEKATNSASRAAWGVLLTGLIVASLMIASAAISLLGAILASIGVDFFRDRPAAVLRLKKYAMVFLVGLAVQGFWMHRKPAPLEWPVPGYPRPYLEQLKVKSGNYPELGMATPKDIALRVAKNAVDHATLLEQMLLRHWFNNAWISPLVLAPVFLILLGWAYSMWSSRGGLQEWFFAGHELIYLLWPWNMEARFFLPVAPLACLYIWRGGQAIIHLVKNKPRLAGAAWLPVSASLTISAWFWINAKWIGKDLPRAALQGKFAFATWMLSAVVSAWMIWWRPSWLRLVAALSSWFRQEFSSLRVSPLRFAQSLALLTVISLAGLGLRTQLEMGRQNQNPDNIAKLVPPDVRAGEWLASHTETNAVIMARQLPTVYHYSQRKMVWFPPSSDAALLMEGIRRLKVNYVVVIQRKNNYYLPPDEESFAKLDAAYPSAFHLVMQGADFTVFQVLATSAVPGVGPRAEGG